MTHSKKEPTTSEHLPTQTTTDIHHSQTLLEPALGMSVGHIHKSVHILCQYFADSFLLYFKTHAFHWNVTGPYFYSLHKLFEEQYEELFESLDEIAERIRALGAFVPAQQKSLQSLASLRESPTAHPPAAAQMIQELLSDHVAVCRNLRKNIEELAGTNDFGTADFLTARLEAHEKTAWMLRSHLETHHAPA